MFYHISHSELACLMLDELRLATAFGERLRIKLDEPIFVNSDYRLHFFLNPGN